MIADIPELIPGFVAGTAAFIFMRKRSGQVKNDLVALVVLAVQGLSSLLLGSPVDIGQFCRKLTAFGVIALNVLVTTLAALLVGYLVWFLLNRGSGKEE